MAATAATGEATATVVVAPPVYVGVDTVAGADAAADARFVAWCAARGITYPKLTYPWWDAATGVRGIGATADIRPGEVLMEVPGDCMVTAPAARRDPAIGHVYAACAALFDADEDVVLAVYLAYHTLAGEASPLAPWMAVTPKTIESVANWDAAAMAELQDAEFVGEAEERNEGLTDTCTALATALTAAFPDLFPPATFTPALVRWAVQTVAARAYGRRLPHAALVPMADVFNHANASVKYGVDPVGSTPGTGAAMAAAARSVRSKLSLVSADASPEDAALVPAMGHSPISLHDSADDDDDDDDTASGVMVIADDGTAVFRLWATRRQGYSAGQEVHNSYGRRGNRHLALEYGFVIENNHWEEVTVRPGAVGDIGPSPAPALSQRVRSIMARAGVGAEPIVLRWNQWQDALLPPFRAFCLTDAEAGFLELQRPPYVLPPFGVHRHALPSRHTTTPYPLITRRCLTRPVTLRNEAAALKLIATYFNRALAYASSSIEEDEAALRAPTSYRHLLALQYRLTRKRMFAQQAAWASAFEAVAAAEAARVARLDSPHYPEDTVASRVATYAAALAHAA